MQHGDNDADHILGGNLPYLLVFQPPKNRRVSMESFVVREWDRDKSTEINAYAETASDDVLYLCIGAHREDIGDHRGEARIETTFRDQAQFQF